MIARDAATGSLLWTFAGDGNSKYAPAVASGYVYVSSDQNVFAIDTTSHTQSWSAPAGGWLAISSHRLLLAGSDGTLTAYLMNG